MKKIIYLTILFIGLCSAYLYAIDGKVIPTINYSINDAWYKSVSTTVPVIDTASEVVAGQDFLVVVLFSDFALDNDNKINVVYDMTVTDQDNKTIYSHENIHGVDSAVENGNMYLKAKGELTISFEPDKPLGKYTINVTLRDLISGKNKEISTSINLVKYKQETFFKDSASFNDWINDYYLHPAPQKAIDGCIYYSLNQRNAQGKQAIPGIFFFFLKIFNDNKYLIPHLIEIYGDQYLKTKAYFIHLLRYADYDSKGFLEKLQGKEEVYYDEVKDKKLIDLYGVIIELSQVHGLWSEFMATGAYKPVEKLINTLYYYKYKGPSDYSTQAGESLAQRINQRYQDVYEAVSSSLEEHCQNQNLARGYCYYALQNDKELDDQSKQLLGDIIKKSQE